MSERFAMAALLLAAWSGSAVCQPQAAKWWGDQRVNRRAPLAMRVDGVPADLPVTVRGSEIRKAAGGESVAAASLRVVGPSGEIPSQLDEFDGGAAPAVNPNHLLDDNDELVFQAAGPGAYWLYWSTEPMPPARYPSLSLMGDAMEAESWQHDIQLWNDRVFLGMRGRARGADPSKNEIGNWGAGVLVQLRFFGHPFLRIHSGWASVFPRGAVGGSPSPEAARWSQPAPMVRGPVRLAARATLAGAEMKSGKTAAGKADLEHRVWLYERGAWVCFDETILPSGAVKPLVSSYDNGFDVGTGPGDRLWYSEKGEAKEFQWTDQQRADGKAGKIVSSVGAIDPWMAGFSPAEKRGVCVIAAWDGSAAAGEERPASFYARNNAVFRYGRKLAEAAAPVRNRLWITGLREGVDGRACMAAWTFLSGPPVGLGPVEKRGGR